MVKLLLGQTNSRSSPGVYFKYHLLFLPYIKDITNGLTSIMKLFADNTSLFPVVHNNSASEKEFNEDLDKINNWEFQWKTNFYLDPSKQSQDVLFIRKLQIVSHLKLSFNNAKVSQTNFQKYLGVVLDSKLIFHYHLEIVFTK